MNKEILISILQSQGYDAITACELVTKFMIVLSKLKPEKYHFLVGDQEVTIQVKKVEPTPGPKCICGQGMGIVNCPIHGFTGGLRPIRDTYYRSPGKYKEESIGKNTNTNTNTNEK